MGKAQSHVPSDWMATPWKHVVTGEKCVVPDWLVSVCWRMFTVAGKSAPKPPVMLVSLIRDTPWQPQVSKKKCVFPKWFGCGFWQSLGEIYQNNCIKCCTTNLFAIDSLLQ